MVKKRWPLLKWLFWIYSNSFGMFSLNVGYFEWWATDWPLTSLSHFEKSASSISRSMDRFQTTCIHLCKPIQENSLTMYGHVTICIPIEQKLCTYRISSHLPSSSQVQETFFRTGLKVWKAQLTNWWLDILPACFDGGYTWLQFVWDFFGFPFCYKFYLQKQTFSFSGRWNKQCASDSIWLKIAALCPHHWSHRPDRPGWPAFVGGWWNFPPLFPAWKARMLMLYYSEEVKYKAEEARANGCSPWR